MEKPPRTKQPSQIEEWINQEEPITLEQLGNLHNWDVWMEGMVTQLQKDKPSIISAYDRRTRGGDIK